MTEEITFRNIKFKQKKEDFEMVTQIIMHQTEKCGEDDNTISNRAQYQNEELQTEASSTAVISVKNSLKSHLLN